MTLYTLTIHYPTRQPERCIIPAVTLRQALQIAYTRYPDASSIHA